MSRQRSKLRSACTRLGCGCFIEPYSPHPTPHTPFLVISQGNVKANSVKSSQGVQEYWIADWQLRQIQVYRREKGTLVLFATLFSGDELDSPLLPGFTCPVSRLFD
ncbi:MAG: Uma2 family endonuclease [Stigonema ocellatum SAG 48.90 = DSM 106950]|nr:Uma2 family endonuclease [Stigonema ocellatum SAG 48.90 = DSM 106950]